MSTGKSDSVNAVDSDGECNVTNESVEEIIQTKRDEYKKKFEHDMEEAANKVGQVEIMMKNVGAIVTELIKENELRVGKVYDTMDSY